MTTRTSPTRALRAQLEDLSGVSPRTTSSCHGGASTSCRCRSTPGPLSIAIRYRNYLAIRPPLCADRYGRLAVGARQAQMALDQEKQWSSPNGIRTRAATLRAGGKQAPAARKFNDSGAYCLVRIGRSRWPCSSTAPACTRPAPAKLATASSPATSTASECSTSSTTKPTRAPRLVSSSSTSVPPPRSAGPTTNREPSTLSLPAI